MNIVEFISDDALLGPHFRGDSWARWKACLKAAFAQPMNARDGELFNEVAGGRAPPPKPVGEFVALVGRGGGKDSVAAALAAYIAVTGDFSRLRPGEKGSILCIATDRDQSGIAFNYIRGLFEQVPMLAGMVERTTADTIDLSNGAEIVVATNSFRAVRGRTIVCAIYDEVCFWHSDDYAHPDVEVDAAVGPGLARWPGALRVMISSVYRRSGLAYSRWKAAFGVDDADTLVVVGDTLQFNPNFDRKVIDRELARDYERASAEYLSRWRDDLSAFIDRAAIEACIVPGCYERARVSGVVYIAFCDPSGGRGDSFTLAIAHRGKDGRAILDAIREIQPPFVPAAVVAEFAMLLKSYNIREVTSDNYAGEWPVSQFREHGITYKASEKVRSLLYLDFLPLVNSGSVELLDHERSVNQLCALERRVARSGKDSVNHPDGGHDDIANSIAGVLVLVADKPEDDSMALWCALAHDEPAAAAGAYERVAGRPMPVTDVEEWAPPPAEAEPMPEPPVAPAPTPRPAQVNLVFDRVVVPVAQYRVGLR